MLKNKLVGVVVPAYNEEKQIGMVIENMPNFVDRIVVVDDGSTDGTVNSVKKYFGTNFNAGMEIKPIQNGDYASRYNKADILLAKKNENEITKFPPSKVMNRYPEKERIILISHQYNCGNGKAIARGYKWCKDHALDCVAIMDGDGQMDPEELESLCLPIVNNEVDYVKGNRFLHGSALVAIPKVRYFGNAMLSILTKITSGYWHVSDTQSGYTAISLRALNRISLYDIYKSYGWPNDVLVKLNIAFCTISETEIKPVYNVGEHSKMKVVKAAPRIFILLIKMFFKRLWIKYFFKDFHPLFLFYNLSFVLGVFSIPYTIKILSYVILGKIVSYETLLLFILLVITSFQCLVSAMWMDIQDNERLYK